MICFDLLFMYLLKNLGFVNKGCVIEIRLDLFVFKILLVILGVLMWFIVIIGIDIVFFKCFDVFLKVFGGIMFVIVGICVLC